MTDPRERELAVFTAARQLPAPERAGYLDEACAGDLALRQRVEELLQAGEEAGAFLEKPAAAPSESMAAVRPELTEKPGDRIGRYKLLQQIGEGGCGVVYMAEQEEPVRRRVALKVIKLGMDTKSVIARFEAERQALALMDHPNIARVLDAGATETGRPYFVMELVRGVKITDHCDQNNLSTRERLDLFIQVCKAIQHAHQKGIIHRDIKPSNILVTMDDGVPVPKVIDFGIAKATQGKLTDQTVFTAFEQFIGTPAYMSPEQAEMSAQDIDTRSDIYSLGVLLYELLTGRTPFDAKKLLQAGLDEIRRTIREQEPARPSTRLSTMLGADLTQIAKARKAEPPKLIHLVRGDLDWIVMKALEKNRTRRYETANGFAADIQRHLNNEPVLARPPSNLYKFQRLVRRNKLAFVAASAVVAALITGLVVSTWMFIKEQQARQQAEAERTTAEAERKEAETEVVKSRQVAQFLKDMLQGVGPSVAMGLDTKLLKEILDKSAEHVGKELTNQPAVELELSTTIGDVYSEIGNAGEGGMKMHQRALELARTLHGGESIEVAEALESLASDLRKRLRNEESVNLYREALDMRRHLQGNNNTNVADLLIELGRAQNYERKFDEAAAKIREGLALRKKLAATNTLEYADGLDALSYVLAESDELVESEAAAREALAVGKRFQDTQPLDYSSMLDDLGVVFISEGKLAEAEIVLREALDLERRFRSLDDSADPVIDFNNLLSVLRDEGKLGEAERELRETEALPAANGGALNNILRSCASWRIRDGQYAQAVADLSRMEELNPGDTWNAYLTAVVLAESGDEPGYRKQCQAMLARFGATSDPEVAAQVAKGALLLPSTGADMELACRLADLAVAPAKDHQTSGWSFLAEALAEYRRGHFASAADWARKAAAFPGKGDTDFGRWYEARSVQAMALLRIQSSDDSRWLLNDTLKRALTTFPSYKHTYFCWVFQEVLVANIFLREALATHKQSLGDTNLKLCPSLNGMALMLRNEGRLDQAEPLYQEALAIRRRVSPYAPERWDSDSVILGAGLAQDHANFLARQGRWKEALPYAAKAVELQPEDYLNHLMLSSLLAVNNDAQGYRQNCARIPLRFGATSDPLVAGRLSAACLINPCTGLDWKALNRMANTAVELGNTNFALPYFQFARALAEYRQGHFAAAAEWARKILAPDEVPFRHAEAWMVLAMSQQQLGQVNDARSALAKGLEVANAKLPSLADGDLGLHWQDWVLAHALMGEATGLISGGSKP